MSIPAYLSYVDSGVEWLGEVPSHWTVQSLKWLTPVLRGASPRPIDDPKYFDEAGEYGWVRIADSTASKGVLLETTQRLSDLGSSLSVKLEPGTLFVSIAGTVGKPCITQIKACIHDGFVYFPGLKIDPRLLFRIFEAGICYGGLGKLGTQLNLNTDTIGSISVAIPPSDEITQLLDFLDREIAKIDALIEDQRRLIALLKEKRQAVISHVVTKGLNPDAPMKDSGIEWLGEVPAHWTVTPLKYLLSLRSGGTPSKAREDYWEGSIPWASAKDLKSECLSDTIDHLSELAISEGGVELNPPGSILILVRGMMLARAFPVAEIAVPMAINQDLKAITPKDGMSPQFLTWALRGTAKQSLDRCSEAGHGTKALRMEDWLSMPLPRPSQDEQQAIAVLLEQETRKVDTLVEVARSAVALLQERRAALISAAVTGKIDVRGSAKVLPFPIDRARARGLIATEIIERLANQPTFGRVKFQKIAFLAEAHVGISELAGSYTREAAGPLDRALIDEMERGARSIAGIEHEQPGGSGTTVSYRLGEQRGAHRQELADWLGADRTAKLDTLMSDCASLTTKQAEAVATLYGVWNDALSSGASPTDEQIISGFLNDWHPEKRDKFRASDLPEWLGWMRRHGIVPNGSGPNTATGRLFV